MVQITEWLKGITFGIFGILLFYFYWDNIFLGMMNFIGSFSISGVTDTTSIAILTTIGWVSLVFLFVVSVPLFSYYTIVSGSRDESKTKPLEVLKGIAIWLVIVPIGLILYILIEVIITALETGVTGISGGMSTSEITIAGQFSWLIGLIAIVGVQALPYYYILKGYGQLGGESGE